MSPWEQQLYAEVKALKARVALLEATLDTLEGVLKKTSGAMDTLIELGAQAEAFMATKDRH